MPPKKKPNEPEIIDISGSFLNRIDLHKYCPKKIFDILFVSEADDHSNKISNKIIEISRGYEDISCLTFITYDEVMDLIQNHENSPLPIAPKMKLVEICTNIKEILRNGHKIPSDIFAQLMKLKLIEVMYKHYIKDVKNMQKRIKLEEDLNILTKECGKAPAGKGKGKDGSKKGKGSEASDKKKGKGAATVVEEVIEDYTTIPIVGENEIIFEDDISKQVWFYVFQGFSDPILPIELISMNNVPITSIIKIRADSSNKDDDTSLQSANIKYTNYWNQLYKYFDGPQRATCLEDTNLMSYNPSGENYMQIFQDLLHVVKSILDIKLQHLHYIRHIEIYKVQKSYNYFPLDCLNVYNRLLEKIPMELTNEPILLNSLLNEVCSRIDNNVWSTAGVWENCASHSTVSARSSRDQCASPCSIGVFFTTELKPESEKIVLRKLKKSFLTYEHDELTIILNSYKKIGPLFYDLTLSMLRNTKPLMNIDEYIHDGKEIIHKHDIDPSTKTNEAIKEKVWHILYLLMFVGFQHDEHLKEFKGIDLTENLQIYDKLEFVESLQTKVLEENDEERASNDISGSVDGDEPAENLYNNSAIKYFWKETLSSIVMPQAIFKTQNEYLYVDQKYSPETDNLLLQFCDFLDEFGVKSKVYEQSLITPVCLRDFCKYVTIDAADWLEANKPPKYTRKSENLEECRGVAKIDQFKIFEEYRYLLNPSVKLDVEEVKEKSSDESKGVPFEYLVEELKNYPPSSEIIEACHKSTKEKCFLAYDFGTKYFKVQGAKTVFHSHDNVKISVDNTRFLDEAPKCTVNLSCKNNSLVLHSNKIYLNKEYIFHMNLSDGTIISFVVINAKTMKGKKKTEKYEEGGEWNIISEDVGETDNKEGEQQEPPDFVTEPKIISVDEDYFKSTIENLEEINPSNFQQAENMLGCLKQATLQDVPIYKVTNKINTNTTLLRKLKPTVKVPVTTIIKRILHKTIRREKFGSFIKRHIPKKKFGASIHHAIDSRICLPNGLYITFYPSEVKKTHVEVKQEFLTRGLENNFTDKEEFRLFTREGYVLIKKINGAITILKSNGDTLNFENIDTDSKNVNKWNLRQCHCKNVNDYRKKLNKMLKNDNEDVTATTAVSRRALFRTKKGYVLNQEIVNMLERSKVPYLKNTLIKFNGNRICLKSMKITQKKIYFITQEQDFYAQEVFFERSDGFTSIFDVNGKQQVKFADGTKISSRIHIAKELVDGYVYISLNFQYEHPSYATVFYHFDYSLEILLNNAVFKREVKDTMSLKIGEDIKTTVQKDNIVFEKGCYNCTSKYNCTFNIKPFRTNHLDFSKEFVHVQDTYNKHFYVDFAGNCTRKSDYIKGPFNVTNCNHWKLMVYKKLFVVNRDFSGEMFRTDNLVIKKKDLFDANENCSVKECPKGHVEVLKFKRKIFNHYRNRFLNISLLQEQHCLSKYKQPEVDGLFYVIYFTTNKMTDLQEIQKFVSNIMANFSSQSNTESGLLDILNKTLDEYEVCMKEDNASMQSKQIEILDIACKCRKIRIGIPDKIRKWRELCGKYRKLIHERDIPLYFVSPFCQIIED